MDAAAQSRLERTSQTEDAFERAAWQYEGSLSGAIDELVAEPA